MATAIIGTVVIGGMIFATVHKFRQIKRGESSCGCGCSGCSKSSACHGINIEDKK